MTCKQMIKLIPTKQLNKPTIQVTRGNKNYYLYSKYNPTRDSKVFAEESHDENIEKYLIYGIGLGYHINELENLIESKGQNYHIYLLNVTKKF